MKHDIPAKNAATHHDDWKISNMANPIMIAETQPRTSVPQSEK